MKDMFLDKELIYKKLCRFIINFKQSQHANLYFASQGRLANPLSYKIDIPRLELILEGSIPMMYINKQGEQQQNMGMTSALFIDKNFLNFPLYEETPYVENISCLFGHDTLGISYSHWKNGQFLDIKQIQIPRKGPRIASHILNGLSEFELNITDMNTAKLLFLALLTHIEYLLKHPTHTLSRKDNLYNDIIIYIKRNSHEALSRVSVADKFDISPDYLSHLFSEKMQMGFKETLNYYRLEKAKSLLKSSDNRITDIAKLSGFQDSNYFCRLFKKQTQRTPTQYRNQYLSSFE